jgi:microcystin-dependent protein
MVYKVQYTESNNPTKVPITVQDQSLNTQTSLTFVGQNYSGYGPVIASDFLHLLENFANSSAPANPVQGQIWYDNANNLLRVWNGTTWVEAGSIKKAGKSTLSAGTPDIASSVAGDLWVDTDNSQLYLFSGSNWLLIGPQYSAGAVSGPVVENIIDTLNFGHAVVSLYASSTDTGLPSRVAIISQDKFTPKLKIPGYLAINRGINLPSDFSQDTILNVNTALWGTASSANSLIYKGKPYTGDNFLRTDSASDGTLNAPLYVKTDSGISFGSNLGFRISTSANTTTFSSSTSGNTVAFSLTSGNSASTLLILDPNTKTVGVGLPANTFASNLKVYGAISTANAGSSTNGTLTVASTLDATALGTASIVTAGGLSVAAKSIHGDDITTNGQLYVNWNNGQAGPAILPGTASTPLSGVFDIGSPTAKFRNIYANSFVGSFNGVFVGSLAGSVNGSAAKLASPTQFSLVGDVLSTNTISFDGQSATGTNGANGTAQFLTQLSTGIFTTKTALTDSQLTDEILINRPGSSQLYKMSKTTLLNHVATVPVGSIFPFAGSTPPSGYLLCDGSELATGVYSLLFNVIGYAYKTPSLLVGAATFALPDLRGRFPLGADNMNNNLTVTSKTNAQTTLSAGGGSANRISATTGSTVGSYGGSQNVTLTTSNLPDHKHSLNNAGNQYYAAGAPNPTTSDTTVAGFGLIQTGATGQGFGLPNSGSMISGQASQPVPTMNPYQTINYIIFTGVI